MKERKQWYIKIVAEHLENTTNAGHRSLWPKFALALSLFSIESNYTEREKPIAVF